MAGSNTVEHKLRLLIETELDEKDKQKVGKQLKSILEGAAIGFDEAETKKNITPIIRMIQKLFDKAEMKFDADKLLSMPSQEALKKVAEMAASEFQTAFDRALQKSGGIKIDFGNMDLSAMTEPLERVTEELIEINRKIANETKKSVNDIDLAIRRLNKVKPKKINAKVTVDGIEKEQVQEINKVDQTVSQIEKTLNAVNNPKSLNTEKTAISVLGKAAENYKKSVEKGDPWETQYQHMVTFVSKYESMTKKIRPIMDENHTEFRDLYDILAPKAGAAKISLEHFVNVARGEELAEYKNQPWAREKTLERVARALENGISVKDNGGDNKGNKPHTPKPGDSAPSVDGGASNGKQNNKNENDSPKPVANKKNLAKELYQGAIREIIESIISDAKTKTVTSWENSQLEKRQQLLQEGLLDRFTFSDAVDDDGLYDFIADLEDLSLGRSKISDIVKNFKPSLISEINGIGRDDFVKKLVQQHNEKANADAAPKVEAADASAGGKVAEGVDSGAIAGISKQIELLAKSSDISTAKKDVVDAIKNGSATVDTRSLVEAMTDVLNKLQEAQNKKDLASVLMENNDLLSQVAQLSHEGGAFYNSKTGFASDVIDGGDHRVETPMDVFKEMSKVYDTRVHKHSFDIAAPSFSGAGNDFETWINVFDDIKKQVIVSGKEVLSFDFSSITKDTLKTIRDIYSQSAGKIKEEFEGYAKEGKVGDMFGSMDNMEEQMQRRFREILESIMMDEKYSGIMTSHKLPQSILDNPQQNITTVISSLTEAINRLSIAQNNNDVVDAIHNLTNNLGVHVGQEDTLLGIKSALETVKSSGFNIDISPEKIVAAIKEALYSPEIAEGYHKLDFDNTFEEFSDGEWINKLHGNILDSRQDAEAEFEAYFKDKWVSFDRAWLGTKEEMLDNIAVNKAVNNAAQRDWPQVIVEAINTQGGKIVEAIKVILPQNMSDALAANDGSFDEAKIRDAFSVLIDNILLLNQVSGEMPRDFFHQLLKDGQNGIVAREYGLDSALRTLGLVSETGQATFTMPDTGIRNLGVAIADRLVATTQDKNNVGNITELQAKLDEASKLGAAVPRILSLGSGDLNGSWWTDEAIFQLQTRQPGVNVASSKSGDEFLQATDEQIDKLIHTFEVMSKVGLFPDFIGDNVLFDKEKGFSLIDLETHNIHSSSMDTPADMVKAFLNNVLGQMWKPDGSVDEFRRRVNERMQLPSDQRLVDGFGRSKSEIRSGLPGADVKLTPVMDDGAVARVVQENVLNTPATVKITPQMDEITDNPVQKLAEQLTNQIVDWRSYDGSINTIENNPLLSMLSKWTLTPSEMGTFDPAKIQEMIAEWINNVISTEFYKGSNGEQLQSLINTELAKLQHPPVDDASTKTSIDAEELKNVLSAITYNVKVVQDEDGSDNKVSIDEASLEATLKTVFVNILNPQTQPSDHESSQEPWARENTLQTIRGVLDNIKTNTSNIGVTTTTIDPIAGTALEGKLTEIKSILESINNKIVKGGVINTIGAVKQANSQPVESEARTQAARSNMMKSLINDYKAMGKLAAQFANDNNLETKAMLENLKEEISRKRQSLRLTMDENKSLREKYSIAFDAEKRLLDAAKAQADIDKQNRQNDRDEKTAWKKQVKDAQRATGINAATTAANAGDQTVVRAIGTKDITKDIENKAQELSKQIKTLRMLRDDIDQKGDDATDKDKERLSQQIVQVKKLKTEVDGYLKLHEKYSGEDATQFDVDTSNFGAVGTDQYWNSITEEIKKASGSRVIIKGMNTDTGELTGTTKIAANTFAEWSATVDPMTHKLSMVRTGIKKTETLVEAIARKTKEVFTYFSGSSIIFKAFNELKQGIQYIREIDLALTELRKVTDETEETYDKFLKNAAETGARLGTTISAVTEATATFAKLGYSMKQATEMAESAIVYKNVGDNIASTEDAADSIISTMKGFGLEATESMAIVDKFNEVGE